MSVNDRGFLYGDGIFETVRAYAGVIFRVDQHLSRLQSSAAAIHLKLPYSPSRLRGILYRTLSENRLKNAVLRLSVSRGVSEPKPDLVEGIRPTVVVIPRVFTGYPENLYMKGLRAVVVSSRHFHPSALDPRIKSTNYLNNILTKAAAKKAGADEGIMLNHQGFLTEATAANLFFVKKGRLCTPSLKTGLLMGITRQAVLELARSIGIPFTEGLFRSRDLEYADECFLTNSSMEIMPVTRLGREHIGRGRPGPITMKLREGFKKLVQKECRISE